jgi:nucleotide-binding universal stress UspA family protein
MSVGPVVIAYDGSPASEQALIEAGALLTLRQALVVVVWEPDLPFALAAQPSLPPAPIDLRTAFDLGEQLYERARHLAQQGADRATAAGLEAKGLAVADDISVAQTILRVAKEQDAQAIVIGSHGHRALREVLLGSTTQTVIRHTEPDRPVVVVRGPQ